MASTLDNQLDINALVEMGFSKERVEQALNATKNQGIQPAIEWLFSHPVADASSGQRLGGDVQDNSENNQSVEKDQELNTPEESKMVALSLVCEECGKQLKSELDAQAHAARTGHQSFAESSEAVKPLTEEEKQAQKLKLHEKLEQRRNQRLIEEKQQEKEREKSRRRTGKEISQAKEEQAYQEMKKLAEERRKEKLEEKRIKQKLKEQIAKDRADFKAKHQATGDAQASASKVSSTVPSAAVKRDFNTCRIQFRLTDGKSVNTNFKAEDTLGHVHAYVVENTNEVSFTLSTTFPRKTFIETDKPKTLKELGLVPSSVLIVNKLV